RTADRNAAGADRFHQAQLCLERPQRASRAARGHRQSRLRARAGVRHRQTRSGAKKKDAFDHVAGVTILNDLTCRDLQKREVASGSRFWTGKNIPGFGPLGPEIVTMDEIRDPYDLWLTCSVNGEERIRVNTRDQIWKLPDLLEHFSRYIPIEPGDMLSTGAPGGVAVGKPNAAELFLKPGDVVECSIEGVATLRTHIVSPGLAERRGHAT